MNKAELNESWPILTGLTVVGLLIHCTCLGADKNISLSDLAGRGNVPHRTQGEEGSCKFMSCTLRVNNKQIRRGAALIEREGFNTVAAGGSGEFITYLCTLCCVTARAGHWREQDVQPVLEFKLSLFTGGRGAAAAAGTECLLLLLGSAGLLQRSWASKYLHLPGQMTERESPVSPGPASICICLDK